MGSLQDREPATFRRPRSGTYRIELDGVAGVGVIPINQCSLHLNRDAYFNYSNMLTPLITYSIEINMLIKANTNKKRLSRPVCTCA